MEFKPTESSLRLRLMLGLFLTGVILVAVYTDIGIIRYKLTGEPNISYWTQNAGESFESEYTACLPLKLAQLSINGGINKALGQREMNSVVRLENGYLTKMALPASKETLDAEADKVAELYETLQSKGIQFVYVATLVKVNENDPELPAGDADYENQNINEFLAELDRKGVPYLDLRKSCEEDGLNSYDLYYKTDHHWTTKGGFWAYTKIADYLEQNIGIDIDDQLTDLSNYDVTTYPHSLLGSRGKSVGTLYAGVDDFDLITPKFETSLTDLESMETGTFENILINKDYLSEEHDLLSGDVYDLALQGAMHTQNNLCTNDSNIILVGDSMSFAVEQYLALSTNRLDILSAYVPNGLAELADGVHPTCVILMQCPMFNMGVDSSFDFGY